VIVARGLPHNMPPHRLRPFLFTWLKTPAANRSRSTADSPSPTPKRSKIKRSATFRSKDHPSLRLAPRSGVPGLVEGGEHGDVAGPSRRTGGACCQQCGEFAIGQRQAGRQPATGHPGDGGRALVVLPDRWPRRQHSFRTRRSATECRFTLAGAGPRSSTRLRLATRWA